MYKNTLRAVFTAVVLGFLSACSSSNSEQTLIESNLHIAGAPDWVNIGSQTVENDNGRLLHGVGMAKVIEDESLQKSVADNRALAEVARILSTKLETVQHDLVTANDGELNSQIKREINAQSQVALSGAKIMGRWKDPKTGTIYAFAELDLSDLDAAVERATALSTSVK